MTDQDTLQRFLFDGTDIRGEISTLANSYQDIIRRQKYPDSVAELFGEFLVAASLLSATLKFPGIITIQATGSGPLNTIMTECTQGNKLRGIVRGDLAAAAVGNVLSDFLGSATLAITIEPEGGERYQGIVPLDADNLSQCLEHYFNQSEQLPTQIKLSANREKASGVLIQQMPSSQSREKIDADWQHTSALLGTLKSEEQLGLGHSEQLYRLFHEDGVRLFEPQNLNFFCSCSKQRTERALISLGHTEVQGIVDEQGAILITCEFCDEQYSFNQSNVDSMFDPDKPVLH
ncbi:MAG: Hsp33 family molecular chaperone HslO [Porticoccaceae bacterium]|jgi:molecular chaperone Hsp33|nr:Hsp33 family molecular chaperone HslO [Porticoccaceae bacterium]MBT5576895.1 Hsp33 family molecular chaperone HslO [Porticoccaceae bacterium]MBT7375346.1 Hsp33 family molecular chaperone HslO [Porticoccaceae bacterium]